jgi:hypothetical protein
MSSSTTDASDSVSEVTGFIGEGDAEMLDVEGDEAIGDTEEGRILKVGRPPPFRRGIVWRNPNASRETRSATLELDGESNQRTRGRTIDDIVQLLFVPNMI